MATLNDIMRDTDNDSMCKEKLRDGVYTLWEFIQAISHTVGNINAGIITDTILLSSDSEDESEEIVLSGNSCVVCLSIRTETWIFMPCRHANCCAECSARILELGQPCPVCRSEIDNRFQIQSGSLIVNPQGTK